MSKPAADPPFEPISPNPFIVGNPVRGRTMFFGREADFELVRNRFQQSDHGGLLVFCGERRSGKTSILFQILDKRLGPEFIAALIDMQSMAITTEADFMNKVVEVVLDAFGPEGTRVPAPEFLAGTNHSAAFQKFIERLMREHPSRKLVLLFDEYELFENKIDAGILGPDVLYMLSSLMEHQSVFLVFTGSQHLEQRRRDYWKILGKSIWKQISYLERSDAMRLMCEPVEGRVRYEPEALDVIFRLAAGQPFYTQAVCQSVVDQLNERRSREVNVGLVVDVAQGLVNNPLPQMIFLWDSLERDQKLVLALLAEALPDERSSVGGAALTRLIHKRDYPLELSAGQLATALETSFRSELLTKDDSHQPPTYAFRMDLWRLWIRRMHSLWQVLREEGLGITRRKGIRIGPLRIRGEFAIAGLVMAGALVWVAIAMFSPRPAAMAGLPVPIGASFTFSLETEPSSASVYLDGKLVSHGAYHGDLDPVHPHAVRLSATGYADSAWSIPAKPGRDIDRGRIALRALLGDLRVETTPPDAVITIDGVARGRSPVIVRDLDVPRTHIIEATSPGRAARTETHSVKAAQLTTVSLAMTSRKTDFVVTTDPPGASLSLDGAPGGPSPHRFAGVPLGRHGFSARLDGYVAADTMVELAAGTGQVHIALVPEAAGAVMIQGDQPAQMYVDGRLVADNVPNSRIQKLARGSHLARVILVSGEAIEKTLVVRSGEITVYDYSKDTIIRSPIK